MDGPVPGDGGRRLADFGALLREPRLRRFLLAGGFSFAAAPALLVVLIWSFATLYPATLSSTQHTQYAALALAALGISATVPTLVAMVFSGALADRYHRQRLLLIVNGVAILATVLIALVLVWRPESPVDLPGASGFYLPLWAFLVLPLWATVTVCATLFRPAYNAAFPRLVATATLATANSLVYVIALVVSLPGDLLTPYVYQSVGPAFAMSVPLALFAVTGLLLLGLRADLDPAQAPARRHFLHDAAEGYRYLWVRKEILQVTLAALAINFLSAVAFVELGLYVTNWLMLGAPIYVGAMLYGSSVGAALGTVLVTRLRFERRAGRYLALFALLQGLMVVGLALSQSFWLSLGIIFLFGMFPGMFVIVFLATVQATVPNDRLGRVLAADEVGSYGLVPIGQYLGGVITLATGVQATYLIAGVGTMAVGAVMASLRGLSRLGFEPSAGVGLAGELVTVPPGALGVDTPAAGAPEAHLRGSSEPA